MLHTQSYMNSADKQTSASPALCLLLQFLHFLAYISSYRVRLANLGEECSHLVSAQEAGSPALQHVQETRFHDTCKRGKEAKSWVLLGIGLLFSECRLLTPTAQVWGQENSAGKRQTQTDRQTRSQNQRVQAAVQSVTISTVSYR